MGQHLDLYWASRRLRHSMSRPRLPDADAVAAQWPHTPGAHPLALTVEVGADLLQRR